MHEVFIFSGNTGFIFTQGIHTTKERKLVENTCTSQNIGAEVTIPKIILNIGL